MSDYPQTARIKSKLFRKGLFHRVLVREFIGNGTLVFATLLGIVAISQLIRFLGDAVSGKLAVEGVLALLGFSALSYLPVLLSMSLFISILLTLSRCYRDSEMVIWFSAGICLTRWVRPVLWYATPVVILIAVLSLILSPWALRKSDDFRAKLQNRDETVSIKPGVFRESEQSDRVYFVEKFDVASGHINRIFVRSIQNGQLGTMVAREGLQETMKNGDHFLVLLHGTRYEGTPGQRDYRIVEFERYAMRIENVESKAALPNVRTLSTPALWQNPSNWNLSELEWRLGLPISAAILALLAIGLSFVNPRAGRSFNLIFAIVLYMIYSNMISVTNAWVGQGKLAPGIGLWGIHALMLFIATALIYWRTTLFSLRRVFRK